MILVNWVKEREEGAKSCRQIRKYTLPEINPLKAEEDRVVKSVMIPTMLIVRETKIVIMLVRRGSQEIPRLHQTAEEDIESNQMERTHKEEEKR